MSLLGVDLFPLNTHADGRGSLLSFEQAHPVPFLLKRVFILRDINVLAERAHHAVSCDEFFVLLSGRCKLEVRSKSAQHIYDLSDREVGVNVRAGIWIRLFDFSEDFSVMVICSKSFKDTEYFQEPQI